MSKYVKYNGKLYEAVDGWGDDAKKVRASCSKTFERCDEDSSYCCQV